MWYDCLEKEKFLSSIYNVIPKLEDIQINKIELDNQMRNVNVIFEMPSYCDNEPDKWIKQNFNVVVVNLRCCNANKIVLSIDEKIRKSSISIKKSINEQISIKIDGNINMEFYAEVAMIEKVSGYKQDRL